MKTLLKTLKWIGIIVLIVVLALVVAVYSMYPPKMDAPQVAIAASADSAVIAQGKYLVLGAAHCAVCHINGDRKKIEELETSIFTKPLSGGLPFTMPGAAFYSANITPDKETGIGRYSDAELARIIRYGVRPDNTIIFPFMRYPNVSDEDLTAIISYLRTLSPVNNKVPPSELNFFWKAISAFFLKPYAPEGDIAKSVARDTSVEYGRCLANAVSGCKDCHTNMDMQTGEFVGEPYAGGQKTPSVTEEPGVWVYTPNLTPDPETGHIYGWSQDEFVERLKNKGRLVKESIMPWEAYRNMSDNDLIAIYKYLQTLPPVNHEVKDLVVHEPQ